MDEGLDDHKAKLIIHSNVLGCEWPNQKLQPVDYIRSSRVEACSTQALPCMWTSGGPNVETRTLFALQRFTAVLD